MRVLFVLACMLILASCSRQARIVMVPMPLHGSLPAKGPLDQSVGIEHHFDPNIRATFVASDGSLRVHLAGQQPLSSNPDECLIVSVWTPNPYRSLRLVLVDPTAFAAWEQRPPELRSAVVSVLADEPSEDVKDRVAFSARRETAKRSLPWWATIDIPWSLLFRAGRPNAAVQVEVYPVRAQRSSEILRLQPNDRK